MTCIKYKFLSSDFKIQNGENNKDAEIFQNILRQNNLLILYGDEEDKVSTFNCSYILWCSLFLNMAFFKNSLHW